MLPLGPTPFESVFDVSFSLDFDVVLYLDSMNTSFLFSLMLAIKHTF